MPLTTLKNRYQYKSTPVFKVDAPRLKIKYQSRKASTPVLQAGDRFVLKKKKPAHVVASSTGKTSYPRIHNAIQRGVTELLKTMQQDNPKMLAVLAQASPAQYPKLLPEIDEKLGFRALSWMLDPNKIRDTSRRADRHKSSRREKRIIKRREDFLDRAKYSSEKAEYFTLPAKQKKLKASATQITEELQNFRLEVKAFAQEFGQMNSQNRDAIIKNGYSLREKAESLKAAQNKIYRQQKLALMKRAKLADKRVRRDANFEELSKQMQLRQQQSRNLESLSENLNESERQLQLHSQMIGDLYASHEIQRSEINAMRAKGYYYLPAHFLALEFTNRQIIRNWDLHRKAEEDLRKQRRLLSIGRINVTEKYRAIAQGLTRLGPQKTLDNL